MEKNIKLPKGITTNKRLPGKYIAQFWDACTHQAKHIKVCDTIEEAIRARQEFITRIVDTGERVQPINRTMPKGIKCRMNKKGMAYYPEVQFWYGKDKSLHMCIHVGTYYDLDEAVQARLDFIENLK